jgi:hypothetical protein
MKRKKRVCKLKVSMNRGVDTSHKIAEWNAQNGEINMNRNGNTHGQGENRRMKRVWGYRAEEIRKQ